MKRRSGPEPPSPLDGRGIHIGVGCYDASVVGLHLSTESDGLLSFEARFAYAAHASAVRALAIHGTTLASGSSDETVRVYDLSRQVEIATLIQHSGSVNALQFARDPVSGGMLLFSAADDATLCVTRAGDWRLLKKLVGHTSPVVDFAVHPSARVALSIARDRSLFMWNLMRGKVAFSAKTKPGPASSIQWSPSGKQYLLTSGNCAALYDGEGQHVSTMTHTGQVLSAAFLDETRVATGGEDKVARVWDARAGTVAATPATHDTRVRAVAALPGVVVSADTAGGLKIWDETRGGAPRLETSIGGGGMRLTRMSMAADTEDEYVVKKRQRTRNTAADAENGNDERAVVAAHDLPNAEAESKPKQGTASTRKRQKRKNKLAQQAVS